MTGILKAVDAATPSAAADPFERRDYDEAEQRLIEQGKHSEAKVRWHKRTGK